MISLPSPLELPIFLILLGILLCLIFEAAGVPEGFRRQGNKNHISLLAAIIVLSVSFLIIGSDVSAPIKQGGLLFDSIAKNATISLSFLFLCVLWIIAERLKPQNLDRGELYALALFSYFTCILLICADFSSPIDLSLLVVAIIACPLGQTGIIAMRKKRKASAEIALKLVVFSAFLLAFASIVLAVSNAALQSASPFSKPSISQLGTIVLLISVILIIMGNVPLQSLQVDLLDGAPSYVSAFSAGATLITCSVILIRIFQSLSLMTDISESLYWCLFALASLSLCLAPIMALDQRRVGRLLAYLLCSQSGIVILGSSLSLHHIIVPQHFYGFLFMHFSLCAIGSYAGLNYWKNASHSFKSWEDFAGAGREHTLAAGSFFVVLASIGGLPFTSGFALRNWIIELTPSYYRVPTILLFLVSIVVFAVPIFRLMAFLFGKSTKHELRKYHRPRQMILLLICALSLCLTSFAPDVFLRSIFN